MNQQPHLQGVARLVLRVLLVAAATVVALVIGASTAQADDTQPDADPTAPAQSAAAADGPPETARPTGRLLERASRTVRESGHRTPALEPVADRVTDVADVVDRGTREAARQVDGVVDVVTGPVGDVADVAEAVLAPVLPAPGTGPGNGADDEAAAETTPAGQQVESPAGGRADRRTDPADLTPIAPAVMSSPAPATEPAAGHLGAQRPVPDSPLPMTIFGLGAFSGAPGAGSGATGGPAPVATLTHAGHLADTQLLGMAGRSDDRLPRTLPRTPGWSPD